MKNDVVLVDMKLKKVKQSLEFSSKADTLEFFYKRIKKSKIEKLICMTVKEWYKNQNSILSRINQNFSGKIIVRSSARGEDSLDVSQAGKFQTIFNIKSTEKNEIKNAVNQIINSYITKGKDDELNQILNSDVINLGSEASESVFEPIAESNNISIIFFNSSPLTTDSFASLPKLTTSEFKLILFKAFNLILSLPLINIPSDFISIFFPEICSSSNVSPTNPSDIK